MAELDLHPPERDRPGRRPLALRQARAPELRLAAHLSPPVKADAVFVVEPTEVGQSLAAIVRARGHARTWSEAKRLVETGKVWIEGRVEPDVAARPRAGTRVELRMREKRLEPPPPGAIVFEDPQVVVFDKPAGVSSVPYEERETGTAMDLIRAHWRVAGRRATETPLHVLHRIDKETSGLIMFAKTKVAEKVLAARFRTHEIERTYLCVAQGRVSDRRIESRLVEDRGDGLRGSTRDPRLGKRAVTHVRALGAVGRVGTWCEVRLETGKTHQIRIHLAEAGHPIVGDRVYTRDLVRRGDTPLPSPRLLLHAATLGFAQPLTSAPLRFESPLPDDFEAAVAALEKL